MKRKPNKPQQEPRERPGSWEEPPIPAALLPGTLGAALQAVPGQRALLDKVSRTWGTPQSRKTLWGEEEQQSGRILAAMPPKELKRSLRRRSSGRKANRSRPPRLSSAWKSAGKSWRRPKASWQNRSPPKKPGPVRRVGRAAGGTVHGFVHGKIYENEQENVGIEGGPPLRAGGRGPPCGMAPGFVKRKVREHRQRPSSGPSPNMSRPRRTITSAWPPRNTRKCPATRFPGCGASTA